MSRTMSVHEFAKEAGVTPSTVYRSISEGKFPLQVIRVGKAMRLRRADVEELLGAPVPEQAA